MSKDELCEAFDEWLDEQGLEYCDLSDKACSKYWDEFMDNLDMDLGD